jgi:hypothetical protein
MSRREYRLSLSNRPLEPSPPLALGVELRQPSSVDREALAVLVLEAYRGTIDDEGEDLDAARAFIAESFAESPLLGASWMAHAAGVPVSAVLLRRWRGQPLVTFVVTHPSHKGERLASALVRRSLSSLVSAGETQAVAFITDGNTPSERLFARLGFERVAALDRTGGAA